MCLFLIKVQACFQNKVKCKKFYLYFHVPIFLHIYILDAHDNRSQTRNKADCLKKLKSFLDLALVEPKSRDQWTDIGEKGKATRKKDKTHRKNVKSNRRGGDFY